MKSVTIAGITYITVNTTRSINEDRCFTVLNIYVAYAEAYKELLRLNTEGLL